MKTPPKKPAPRRRVARLEAAPPGPYAIKVAPPVWKAARAAQRPGTSLVVVSETVVRIVNDPPD
jgi:hypothetical protein